MLVILATPQLACKKYLDEKAIASQHIPSTIGDLQALFDNNAVINSREPALLELVADNYYVTTSSYQTLLAGSAINASNALNYNWDSKATPLDASWTSVYQGPIYYANIVLEHLDKIEPTDPSLYNKARGSALFYRAFSFFDLAQLFCLPYRSSSDSDPGIVLRMTSDINIRSVRASVKETYERIVNDLKEAAELLPLVTAFASQPTKAAAYGQLARVYLSMRDYPNAKQYAQLCLDNTSKTLLDYNDLIPLQTPRIRSFNQEVVYHSNPQLGVIMGATHARIDTVLYASYQTDDLRKTIFFNPNTGANLGTYSFQGSYHGNGGVGSIFNGITIGEILLVKAECLARDGQTTEALDVLNFLMRRRWRNTVSYPVITAANPQEALSKILTERRKELVFRGLRWTDLRRFNEEGANITLKRIIGGTEYSLPPGDPRWLMLIPYDVINLSGIAQNPR